MSEQSQISQLHNSAYISQTLNAIKNDVQDKRNYTHYPQDSASSFLEKAINVRMGFRELAQGIEAKRLLGQLQKQKIQKCKIFLEGLQYFKETLKNKIKQSHIEIIDLTEYLDEPIQVNDWIEQFTNAENHLMNQVESKRQKKKRYEQLLLQKQRRELESSQKKEFFQKVLPQHAKKIYQQIQETSKMLNIQQFDDLEKINNRDLAIIYDKLNPLRTNKIIELACSREEFEQIEIVIGISAHQWFTMANKNKINISEREITFTFTCLCPHFDGIVIGLNRRQDFTNEEVFQRLYNNQEIQQIFSNPQNEMQRNINAKYVKLPWIGALLNGVISPQRLLQLIKERVFCLQLMRYLCENMKKVSFFFPFNPKEDSYPVPANLKKVTTGSLQKISFKQYLQLVHLPTWVNKYLNNYQLLQSQYKLKNIDAQMREKIQKGDFQAILKIMNLEELSEANLNSYYKGSFTIPHNVLTFILILPIAFPLQPSKVYILQWETNKKEQDKASKLEVSCKLTFKASQFAIHDNLLGMELAVNQQLSQFIDQHQQYVAFRVLFQLNRMLTILGQHKHSNE